jgi:glutamine amidotransferase
MRPSVTIVDYGSGNVFSVASALKHSGASVKLASDPDAICKAERLVLPGVGAFGAVMTVLEERGLVAGILAFVSTGRPFLGICVGQQALMDVGEEFGRHYGMGLIQGTVSPIKPTAADGTIHPVPHTGWSALIPSERGWVGSMFEGLKPETPVYFVHSFAAVPDSRKHVLATCDYDGNEIVAAIIKDNLTGCQFHPEKSGPVGLVILKNFCGLTQGE